MTRSISRDEHLVRHGPTTGDRVRLGDTDLWIRIEDDLTEPADQALWGYANGTVRAVYQMASRDGTFTGRVIESSVPAGPGSSGSPVLNAAGEVIGVVFANKRNARRVTLSVDAAEVRVLLATAQAVSKVNADR